MANSVFFNKLTRNNTQVQKERAKKLEKVTKSEADIAVNEIENKILNIEDQLDSQLDVTASNDANTLNKISDWKGKEFIRERIKLEVELENLNVNLKAAKKVRSDMFGS